MLFCMKLGLGGVIFVLLAVGTVGNVAASPQWGFNTHLSMKGWNLGPGQFRENVDRLEANGTYWLRVNLQDLEVVSGVEGTTIVWDETALAAWKAEIAYAKSKGMKLILVTNPPTAANHLPFNEYLQVTDSYYRRLGQEFFETMEYWQIFNEADIHDFKTYQLLDESQLTPTYLDELGTAIMVARQALEAVDPQVRITASVGGYPFDETTRARWVKYFDALEPELTAMSLDIYPNDNYAEVEANLGAAVEEIGTRYQRPVVVSEIGVCTGAGYLSETDQSNLVPMYLEKLETSSAYAVLVYEIQDEGVPSSFGDTTSQCESSFGIVRYDGSQKPAYDSVMELMGNPVTASCRANFNGDGLVDLSDFSILASEFFKRGEGLRADINADQFVDLSDFSILASEFLNRCN